MGKMRTTKKWTWLRSWSSWVHLSLCRTWTDQPKQQLLGCNLCEAFTLWKAADVYPTHQEMRAQRAVLWTSRPPQPSLHYKGSKGAKRVFYHEFMETNFSFCFCKGKDLVFFWWKGWDLEGRYTHACQLR